MTETHRLATRLWRWTGGNGGSWFFVNITGQVAEAIAATALMLRLESGWSRGFGSVKVIVELGDSRWATSVFPVKTGGYLLPVKGAVRRAEGIGEGDEIELVLEF